MESVLLNFQITGSHNLKKSRLMTPIAVFCWNLILLKGAPRHWSLVHGPFRLEPVKIVEYKKSLHAKVDFFNTVDGNKFPKDTFFWIKIIKMHIFSYSFFFARLHSNVFVKIGWVVNKIKDILYEKCQLQLFIKNK